MTYESFCKAGGSGLYAHYKSMTKLFSTLYPEYHVEVLCVLICIVFRGSFIDFRNLIKFERLRKCFPNDSCFYVNMYRMYPCSDHEMKRKENDQRSFSFLVSS